MNTFLIFKVFTCSLVLLLSLSKPPQDSRNSQWKYKQTPNWSQNWNDNIVLLFARIGSTNNGIFTRTKIEIFTQTSQQQGWWQQLNARQRNTIRKLWPKKKELNFFLMPELICRNIMFRISVYAIDLCDTVICLSYKSKRLLILLYKNNKVYIIFILFILKNSNPVHWKRKYPYYEAVWI